MLDGRIQAQSNSSADTCTPNVPYGTTSTASPVRVQSHRAAPTSSIMLRRMGTSTSFGCYLGVDINNGILKSELLQSGIETKKTNRFEIHSLDSFTRKIVLNSITIATNSTTPPQVRWRPHGEGGGVTGLSYDRVTLHWKQPSDNGGPIVNKYNITTVGIVHQIISINLISISQRWSSDQFKIGREGSDVTTSCLSASASAETVRDALLNANLTGYYETRAIHVSR